MSTQSTSAVRLHWISWQDGAPKKGGGKKKDVLYSPPVATLDTGIVLDA